MFIGLLKLLSFVGNQLKYIDMSEPSCSGNIGVE